ncbi:Homeodomain-like [Nostoc flagelliforme CCNUN1]|uniref:Homeodomain-like n=1 Tax=Nostoc flagelliforme CCNUN1 TaxID=2038116 RepID=A0A2K8SL15_9NOSO|nr:helix-turn-helix domain-containing protein [Nostoc flagelliforme]AUB36131.1 Homeodomain-like [Nostoc flagelliforme CCNUN1]
MAKQPIELGNKEIQQIRVMAGMGLSIEKIALILGFSVATFYRKKKLLPEVKSAYDMGLAQSEYSISKTLYEMATTDKNLTAIIWWEKTRFGRSERAEISHTVQTDDKPQILVYLPDNGRDEVKLNKQPKEA